VAKRQKTESIEVENTTTGEETAGRIILRIALWIAALMAAALLFQGNIVRVNCVELPVKSLPQGFDGTTVAFVSDLHITTLNSRSKVEALIRDIEAIHPDLLLLGGDYTGSDLLLRVAVGRNNSNYVTRMTEMRDLFFMSLAKIECPLGKFAVAGDMDNILERESGTRLEEAARLGGVTVLRDESVRLWRNGDSIVLTGVDDWRTGMNDTRSPAQGVDWDDCVLLLSHTPEALPQLVNQSSSGEREWIDIALTGHTLGGQFRIKGNELLNPLAEKERYQSGWHMESGAKLLIIQGVSPETLPVRWGTTGQAHIITLRRD